MTDRRKPPVGFWIIVALVALLVAYPLSTGPADWMRAHGWLSQGTVKTLDRFYSPLPWTYKNSPALVRRGIDWYAHLWR
jgi:hypothetical protein